MKDKEAIRILTGMYYDFLSDKQVDALDYVIKKLKGDISFPEPVDNFEIRLPTYLPGYEPPITSDNVKFDIVKWQDDGEHKSCYSVGSLIWDEHEGWFKFESVGLRWLEARPSHAVCRMIIDFCEAVSKKYREEEIS